MTTAPPSWIELMGRHAASTLLYLSGSLTYRYVSRTGTVEDGAWEFLHGPGDRWRIEKAGQPILIRKGDVAFSWRDDEMHRQKAQIHLHILKPISPTLFVGPDSFLSPNTLSKKVAPTGPVTETAVGGRRAWSLRMSDPSTADTMEFAIDDVTGLLLRVRSSNGKLTAEVIDVEIYEHLPDTTFDWDGEIAPQSENERHRHPDHLRKVHFLAQEIAPRYWPTGVDVQPVVGDPHTGEVVASLTVEGHPTLARWPRQAQPTLIAPELARRYRHSVEWSDDHWQWRLMTATPITQGDLEQIRNSIQG
ncbi:hypothetical protein CBI38_29375 [Rhodococcus oxybenzonivorans]|uniref:MucB/RseB N-terminal domain-containing protein n=1 Tax=Rhodococcus oxybenzonivorans TaxID=1990687 RepID=A0A2S2C2K3_9NOCA|nr:hypothetical protein [Rhodococcus oxybenzonivorans]AWK75053.1 hypothetical protein CBI38_29375 [Rhodococcus oxybenzonivorans]